jgi:Tfp pilus assembly protein FimV
MRFYFLAMTLLVISLNAQADSRQIEVRPAGQAFIDVNRGDTLGEIVNELLPNNATRRARLMAEIVELNPRAFIDQDPGRMKANVRLWLPGHVSALQQARDSGQYRIREFSWGYTQQPK